MTALDSTPHSTDRPSGDRGSLGLGMSTALVIGNMIGSGVFLLPSALASYGSVSILGWLFTSAGALLIALVFARMGRAYPQTGGPYVYSRRAFGGFVGFQTAWGHWIALWAGNAAIVVAFVGYLAHFWDDLGTNSLLAAVVGLLAIWGLTAVNAAGVLAGGMVQAVTTVLKLVPLVAIAVLGLFFIDVDNLREFNNSGKSTFGAVTSVATLTLWAFIGIESAAVPAEDVKDPERTVPRATVLGTVIAAVVYILGTVAVMGIVPADVLASSTAPFADAATAMYGDWAGNAVAVGAIISAFGALNGWILLQGQVPLAAARDGLFPKVFARTSANGTPVVGLVVSSGLITALMLMNYNASLVDQFTFVILLATLTALIPYAYSAAAEVMLFMTEPERFSGVNFVKDTLIAALAFAYSLWAIAGSGDDIVYKGTMLLLAGIPVYLWIVYRSSRHGAAANAGAADLRSHAHTADRS